MWQGHCSSCKNIPLPRLWAAHLSPKPSALEPFSSPVDTDPSPTLPAHWAGQEGCVGLVHTPLSAPLALLPESPTQPRLPQACPSWLGSRRLPGPGSGTKAVSAHSLGATGDDWWERACPTGVHGAGGWTSQATLGTRRGRCTKRALCSVNARLSPGPTGSPELGCPGLCALASASRGYGCSDLSPGPLR